MAWTIGLAGREDDRRRGLIVHSIGTLLGSLTMAFLLILAAPATRALIDSAGSAAATGAAVVLIAWVPRTLGRRGPAYPRSSWQVPEHWRQTLPMLFTLVLYGFLLGLGILTDVVLPAYWVLVGGSLAVVSLPAVVIAWTAYGITRAYVVLVGVRQLASSPADEAPEICSATQLSNSRRLVASLLVVIAGMFLFA
jgi:hypothetical protein